MVLKHISEGCGDKADAGYGAGGKKRGCIRDAACVFQGCNGNHDEASERLGHEISG